MQYNPYNQDKCSTMKDENALDQGEAAHDFGTNLTQNFVVNKNTTFVLITQCIKMVKLYKEYI